MKRPKRLLYMLIVRWLEHCISNVTPNNMELSSAISGAKNTRLIESSRVEVPLPLKAGCLQHTTVRSVRVTNFCQFSHYESNIG